MSVVCSAQSLDATKHPVRPCVDYSVERGEGPYSQVVLSLSDQMSNANSSSHPDHDVRLMAQVTWKKVDAALAPSLAGLTSSFTNFSAQKA